MAAAMVEPMEPPTLATIDSIERIAGISCWVETAFTVIYSQIIKVPPPNAMKIMHVARYDTSICGCRKWIIRPTPGIVLGTPKYSAYHLSRPLYRMIMPMTTRQKQGPMV